MASDGRGRAAVCPRWRSEAKEIETISATEKTDIAVTGGGSGGLSAAAGEDSSGEEQAVVLEL